ncbi:hypothetical protein GCM10009682_35160 [Luedemannella flava]|uniref:Uncharacterized protein n=1 Tax=Luedemannella flava TaxID=349316 RepID=A0ABP4YDT1_9ACTN
MQADDDRVDGQLGRVGVDQAESGGQGRKAGSGHVAAPDWYVWAGRTHQMLAAPVTRGDSPGETAGVGLAL